MTTLQGKIESGQLIIVIEHSDPSSFEEDCNLLAGKGYTISSSSCGFVDSANYDFCSSYQAVFEFKRVSN